MLVVVDCGGGGMMMMMMMILGSVSFIRFYCFSVVMATTYDVQYPYPTPRGSSDCAHARPVNLLKLCSQFAHVGEQSLSKS
jgi:hypothetical protein